MASIHTSDATMTPMMAMFAHVVLCFIPPRSTSYLQTCDVAVFRSFKSCIQTQVDHDTGLLRPRRFLRSEHSMAAPVCGRMGGLRSHCPSATKNQVWTTPTATAISAML